MGCLFFELVHGVNVYLGKACKRGSLVLEAGWSSCLFILTIMYGQFKYMVTRYIVSIITGLNITVARVLYSIGRLVGD